MESSQPAGRDDDASNAVTAAVLNVTIALEEDVARWARLEAARQDTSVSRLIAGMLNQRMLELDSYERAMRRALARKPFFHSEDAPPSREEVP
jgi:hypothetical protein